MGIPTIGNVPRSPKGTAKGPLTDFHPIIADWFQEKIGEPTDVQAASWPAICSGEHALIAAPTGSGKTLAAFLASLDSLFHQALSKDLTDQTQILYVSPLKALSNDVQKNLRQPLAEISEKSLEAGLLLPEIRVEVRTGDTPTKTRQDILQRPPHILITTPESFFLLLTARKSREILRTVRTVIIDEIHALAGNKRGSHLALSLERLDALTQSKANRIGLSATQKPLDEIAQFLVGGTTQISNQGQAEWAANPCHIVNMGQRQDMDLAIETPKDELGAIATNAIWADIYDRLMELVQEHRSTLVFVNTRRLAERIAHHLTERLGEEVVATHHGSLSRKIRLSAEERLKTGKTRVVIATASLELGIDIGFVDLVCQIGSPRAIATCLQRIGRAGHWVGATPKGRLFCTTRDELMECAALVRAIHRSNLDRIIIPEHPKDILAQQLVAEVAAQEWSEEALYQLITQAYPYRNISKKEFDEVLSMLAHGFIPNGGRQHAYLFHDRMQGQLRPRRGARLAAITSGGAIPDTATYAVVAEPQGITIGTVDEDFAVESLAGDIILLGNTSWRIRGVETGVMRVEDAQGAPPTIPFWRGEAPSRTFELSQEVGDLRQAIIDQLNLTTTTPPSELYPNLDNIAWLASECGADNRAASQIIAYQQSGLKMLGAVPTQQRLIAERFFDEAGGMQLVIHSPFGGRINRAWGIALRKRFCVSFDFELQAAATDEGLVLSLGEKHSFPLETVWSLLHSNTVREVLTQAVLQAPMFLARWRWNASRALALLRFRNGTRVPLHLQRMRAEDLLTAVFPMATACQDNRPPGNIEVPNHPLVQETIRDCLEEAMDIDGLITILEKIETGTIRCISVESPVPSPFSHEILNANPYAFLDDAPLEERRSRAVNMRQMLSPEEAATVGALDANAIESVCKEAWPIVRDPDELQEALHLLMWVPEDLVQPWKEFLPALLDSGRAHILCYSSLQGESQSPTTFWAIPDHLPLITRACPGGITSETITEYATDTFSGDQLEAQTAIVRSWMEVIGPITATELGTKLRWPTQTIHTAFQQLEAQGQILQGTFRGSSEKPVGEVEWCDRRLLARIHRRTVVSLRREIEAVSASDFMRFLFRWQHVAPTARLHGENGLREILQQLSGFEAAASAWEPYLLASRMGRYNPELLDYHCLRGNVTWGRLTPPTMDNDLTSIKHKKRIIPTSLAPINVFPREDAEWLLTLARHTPKGTQALLPGKLSALAQAVYSFLSQRGASFFGDLTRGTGHLQAEIEQGLWELASVGIVTADGFDNLRALIDPKRRRGIGRQQKQRPRNTIGRWSLLTIHPDEREKDEPVLNPTESWARQLLKRYGIVFRDLLKRESLSVAWRDLLMIYRQLELRGEIRGGRFVAGFTGEQFGLPEAVEALRAVRKDPQVGAQEIHLSGSDPLNLVGIILPGDRIPAHPSQQVVYHNGVPIVSQALSVALA
ncbi:DEAD/DEAH box helicase [Candidatus Nitronereus thalassa]|uniref:DEAD/DEAH box helicase n=1 Tax=Candidatus Nitronereus thalassa TaxID=3020898 RepID=A0ABU3K4S7_9BACT|nr:DEAD/DEAH box helicase [Candidatus Nitronereus thalassa]MDT7041396.1 DEAD/DEAH box helicase [Candidatus Nitronereus thalassa]